MARSRFRNADTFDGYRRMDAKFDSVCRCGLPILRGERMAYNPYSKRAICTGCLNAWAESVADEERYMSSIGGC